MGWRNEGVTALGKQKTLLTVLLFFVLAVLAGVLAAWWILSYMQLHLPIRNQNAVITIPAPVQARAKVLDALDVQVQGNISTEVPVNQNIAIPVQDTLNTMIHFDHDVPIKMDVPVQNVVPVDQTVPVDTHVTVNVLGKDITLPVKGNIPIKMQVPIKFTVPVNQQVHLTFDAPAQAKLKQDLHVPLNAKINATIPIHGTMQVPVKSDLHAQVFLSDPMPATIVKSDLEIPLSGLSLLQTPPANKSTQPEVALSPEMLLKDMDTHQGATK